MKLILHLFFYSCFVINLSAQNIGSIDNSTELISSTKKYINQDFVLIIHSTPFCGYCWKLKSYLKQIEFTNYIEVVFIEYDGDSTLFFKNENSYNGAEVRVIKPKKSESVKFFPTLELYSKPKNKKLKKIKGFKTNSFDKILTLSGYNEYLETHK